MTANVKKCAVVVCNEDKVNPVTFKWKCGEDELPIADQYTYLGVEISEDCSWDAHNGSKKGLSTRRQDGCDPNRLAP